MIPWKYLKEVIDQKGIYPQYTQDETSYFIKLYESGILLGECIIHKSLNVEDKDEFETYYKSYSNKPISVFQSAFALKTYGQYKIFTRNLGYKYQCAANEPTVCDLVIPYAKCKIVGLEVTGSENGDTATLQVLDTESGTVSTIPYHMLNEFATNLNIPKDYYAREAKYDADLFAGLTIRIIYTSVTEKTIGINYLIHELKM